MSKLSEILKEEMDRVINKAISDLMNYDTDIGIKFMVNMISGMPLLVETYLKEEKGE